MDGTVLVIAIFLGLIPASIASNKGHNFLVWWFFGAALFIVALPLAIMLKPNTKEVEQNQIQSGEMKKCPYCAELIKSEAVICRYCGKELPTFKSISVELQEIVLERKAIHAEIQPDEIGKWKAGFDKIGWLETIGENTRSALSTSPDGYGTIREPLLCVTYADVKGSRITGLSFNDMDLYDSFAALIATPTRIILVNPKKAVVKFVEYGKITRVENIAQGVSTLFAITSVTGETAKIKVDLKNPEDENIVKIFFERISSTK